MDIFKIPHELSRTLDLRFNTIKRPVDEDILGHVQSSCFIENSTLRLKSILFFNTEYLLRFHKHAPWGELKYIVKCLQICQP